MCAPACPACGYPWAGPFRQVTPGDSVLVLRCSRWTRRNGVAGCSRWSVVRLVRQPGEAHTTTTVAQLPPVKRVEFSLVDFVRALRALRFPEDGLRNLAADLLESIRVPKAA